MKRFLLLCLSQCATDCGSGKFYKYTVNNQSGKNITIKGYLPSFPDVRPTVNYIENGMELTKTHQDHLPPSPNGYGFRNFFGDSNNPKESIKVLFGNDKVSYLTTKDSENERNPLNREIYDGLKKSLYLQKKTMRTQKIAMGIVNDSELQMNQ